MSALDRPSSQHHGRRDMEPGGSDGFLRLAKAAAERAARAGERARRAGIRLQRLRAGLPRADHDSLGPVPVPLRAALDQSVAYQVLATVHERAARHFESCAERGSGDVAHHRERAAWHSGAAERARKARAAWAASYRVAGPAEPSS
ncbi:hypothetical protein [Nonomuraea sp. NPDC050202]|uniref:hypothetical protein n=1 Tax=Nonomuraea sp. NPDC050202 TaxID=3155035 RepID=UPI0034105199